MPILRRECRGGGETEGRPCPPGRGVRGSTRGSLRGLEAEALPSGEGRSRLDAWISGRLGGGGVSRARVRASIRAGLVAVYDRRASKGRDMVCCTVSELQPLMAEAEDIPLHIVYEDEHLLVVNKPAHMLLVK